MTYNTEASSRQRLLSAAEGGTKGLESFFTSLTIGHNETVILYKGNQKYKANKLTVHLSDVLQELDKKQANILWESICKICVEVLHQYADLLKPNSEENGADIKSIHETTTKIIQNICILCTAAVSAEESYIAEGLLHTVLLLHGVMLDFEKRDSRLAQMICRLCVEWWDKDMKKKEELCLHSLIYLLNEILSGGLSNKGTASSLTQLCRLQKALSLFDFSDEFTNMETLGVDQMMQENVQELKQLLIASALHPSFIRGANGKKFLSAVFLLHTDLMKVLHNAILDHVLKPGNDKYSDAYGSVYYQAWVIADGQNKEHVEDIGIQDLMYRAVHSRRGRPNSHCPFSTFQLILQTITCNKGTEQVRHVLARLYSPIMWRSLKATNAMVRANAASLLFDSFPLIPVASSVRQQEQDELLQRQFTAIDDLIMDPTPQVRSIAILGLCDIHRHYWDVIPAHVLAVQARNLFTNMAFDSSSVEVREAVFRGAIILLSNPCTHPLLKKLLPTVGVCLHDTSEKVRVAVADVLLAVKQTNSILFWEVCPVENILAQLEVENPTGTKRLVKLLTGSFLSAEQSVQVWVQRCVSFYGKNATAARKFYLYTKDNMSVSEAGQFVLLATSFVYNNVSRSLQMEQSEEEQEDKEQLDSSVEVVESPSLIAGLLETICLFWSVFQKKYPSFSKEGNTDESEARKKRGKKSNDELRDLAKRIAINLPRAVHVCLKKYHDERTINVLLQLSSLLHPASIPVFSKSLFPKLRSLPDDAPVSYYSMLIRCMVRWGWSRQVLELLRDWLKDLSADELTSEVELTSGASKEAIPPKRAARKSKSKSSTAEAAGKKSKNKTVQFSGVQHESRPVQGIKYLKCFLADEDALKELLDDTRTAALLHEIDQCLRGSFVDLETRLQGQAPVRAEHSDEFLTNCLKIRLEMLSRFCTYESSDAEEQANSSKPERTSKFVVELGRIIEWAHVSLIDNLKATSQVLQNQNTSMMASASLTTTLNDSAKPTSTSVLLNRISLIRACLDVVFPCFGKLLKSGIPVADHVLQFLAAFTDCGIKTVDYAGHVAALFLELHDCLLLELPRSEDMETDSVEARMGEKEQALIQIFDDLLLALMIYNRQNPDGFQEIFRKELKSRTRSLLQSEFLLRSGLTRLTYQTYATKLVSAILADLTHHLHTCSSFEANERISDLPQFCACLLPLLCSTSTKCEHICRETLPGIVCDDNFLPEEKAMKKCAARAAVSIAYVLIKDGKNASSARNCLDLLKLYVENNHTLLSENSTHLAMAIFNCTLLYVLNCLLVFDDLPRQDDEPSNKAAENTLEVRPSYLLVTKHEEYATAAQGLA